MTNQPKQCPFCGGDAEYVYAPPWFWYQCKRCKRSTKRAKTLEEALNYWNYRLIEDALRNQAGTALLFNLLFFGELRRTFRWKCEKQTEELDAKFGGREARLASIEKTFKENKKKSEEYLASLPPFEGDCEICHDSGINEIDECRKSYKITYELCGCIEGKLDAQQNRIDELVDIAHELLMEMPTLTEKDRKHKNTIRKEIDASKKARPAV